MHKKAWSRLMTSMDPFDTHSRARKFDVWTQELEELNALIERARTDRTALATSKARKLGGRLTDVRKRIKHIEEKLNSAPMKFERRKREKQEQARLSA
jgi:hypothetical protein